MPAILPAKSASRSLNKLGMRTCISDQLLGSSRLDAGLANDVAPALRFRFDESGRFSGRAAAGADAELLETLQQGGIVQCRVGRGIELGDDGVRRLRRCR